MKRPIPPDALRRTLYLRRRPLAALCAFAAVLAGLLALTPDRGDTVTVVVAGGALPAGTVLAAEHLTALDIPAAVAPDGAATSREALVGRTLAAPVSARTVLTAATVSEGERLAREGHVVVALPAGDDAVAGLLRPGARIDVWDAQGEVLARDVRVIAPRDTPSGGNLGLSAAGRSVLVEVPEATAAKIASQGAMSLTVALR